LLAARKLGMAEVPCLRLGYLSEIQKRAYVIADNKLALNSGWDDEMLGVELGELANGEFELELLGFSEGELKDLLKLAEETDLPDLATGDKQPFQQMTFTLHDEQAEELDRALRKAKEMGPFVDSLNENSNGNALARICEIFLTKNGRPEDEYGER
jgi:ParB-like chromosome segregation protein Spo0J